MEDEHIPLRGVVGGLGLRLRLDVRLRRPGMVVFPRSGRRVIAGLECGTETDAAEQGTCDPQETSA